jgi:Transposase C of IS166 homeodomain
MKLMIEKLRHMNFGAESEKIVMKLEQLEFGLEGEETTQAEMEAVLDRVSPAAGFHKRDHAIWLVRTA